MYKILIAACVVVMSSCGSSQQIVSSENNENNGLQSPNSTSKETNTIKVRGLDDNEPRVQKVDMSK